MNMRMKTGGAIPVLVAVLLAAAPAAGQDVDRLEARRAVRAERQAARHEMALQRLATRLELTDAQKAAVAEVMRVDEETGQRGDGWVLAAVLDRELSEEQLGLLFDASRDAVIYRRGMAAGLRRGSRVPNRGTAVAPAGLREARLASMQKALGLTDHQVRVLRIHDALTGVVGARVQARTDRFRGRRPARPGRRFGR